MGVCPVATGNPGRDPKRSGLDCETETAVVQLSALSPWLSCDSGVCLWDITSEPVALGAELGL